MLVSGQPRADDVHAFAGRNSNPTVAGTVAVSLVALLVIFGRTFLDEDWTRSWSFLLPVAALATLAAGWWAMARVSARLKVSPRSRQVSGKPEGRGARRHRRYVPANRVTMLHTQDGRRIGARIANISVAAVAVDAKISDLDYMAVLRVGSRGVGPIRRTPTGAVFGFTDLLDPQPFDRSFTLEGA